MMEKGAGGEGAGGRSVEDRGKRSEHPDVDATTCPRCGESNDLAKVKGCIKCLKCGFKFDCNGW
jgi:ribosomal protein S27AE